MSQKSFKRTGQAVLLASIAAAFPVVSHGAPAARVDFAVGDVTAVNAAGQARPLGKGAQIEQGETIATNNGRAQLRFTDGAYMSLQPQSEFRIDQYLYEGKEDGSEKGLFSLIKGGLRTITGFVGRTNKRNYQVTTSVATIGIRGTEYTIQYGNSISGTVGEGEIEVCNGAGCLNVTDGETYYVQNQDVKPQLSNKGTDLPPAPPENPPSDFEEGENVNEDGDPCALFPETCQIEPPPTAILTGTITANVATVDNCDGACTSLFTPTTATLDGAGVLTSFGVFSPQTFTSPSSAGNDGIIAWGSASASSGGELGTTNFIHYVVGLPADNIGTLGDVMGHYNLLGGTAIIDSSGQAIGKLNSATMTYFFSSGIGDLNMTMTLPGGTHTANSNVSGQGSTFSFSNFSQSVNVSGEGFFSGTNAVRAGIVYGVTGFDQQQQFFDGMGAGALKQNSLIDAPPR